MKNEIIEKLKHMGLSRKWLEYGFVDESFIEQEFKKSNDIKEHGRTPFYGKVFSDRKDCGFIDKDIQHYLELVALESDAMLKSWALSFIVECDILTQKQLSDLSQHHLITNSEKHLGFLRRNLLRVGSD